MFAIMQNLLYGCQITAEKHISDSMMYQKLAGKTGRGRVPVYGKYLYLYFPSIKTRQIIFRFKTHIGEYFQN